MEEFGSELWRIEAGSSRATLVRDICPGSCGSINGLLSRGLLGGAEELVPFSADNGVLGSELWITDGTFEGTALLAGMAPSFESSRPWPILQAHDGLYMRAWTPSTGDELWFSDGTPDGTFLVKDVNPGENGSQVWEAIKGADGNVYVIATTEESGRELWRTDGSGEGTQQVVDLLPGPESGVPFNFGVFYTHVPTSFALAPWGDIVFEGTNGISGLEVWRTNGTAGGTSTLADIPG